MRFIYNPNCGENEIILNGSSFHHIFDVRRQKNKKGDILKFANLKDSKIYSYKIKEQNKKDVYLTCEDSIKIIQKSPKTHIIQAIIDMNDFSKILPSLNELFVQKITFFYSDFSSKNQKINIKRLQKILINSCMQCGRLDLMEIEILRNLDEVLRNYKNAIALDFDKSPINFKIQNSIIIGAEGGFSQNERLMLKNRSFSINHSLILKSITASIYIASNKILF